MILNNIKRANTLATPSEALRQALVGDSAYSGKNVNATTALGLGAVYSAVRARAEAVGMLPLVPYRRDANGDRERLERAHPLWNLLHDEPNPWMSAQLLWEMVEGHLSLWGNAYLYKKREAGRVVELWPLRPDRVKVGVTGGERVFEVTNPDGTIAAANDRDILHIKNFGYDTLVGLSPINLHRQQFGTMLAAQEFRGRFYSNGAHLRGVLKVPGKLSPEAAKTLKAQWDSMHRGLDKVARTAVLEDGTSWEQLGLSMEDQQYVQAQQLDVAEVARIFRVPPTVINAETGRSLQYSTVEGQGVDFIKFGIGPSLRRIESALWLDGDLPWDSERNLYVEFLVDALLRSDTKARYEAHALAIQNRIKTPNEVRRDENLPPVDGGDEMQTTKPTEGVDAD